MKFKIQYIILAVVVAIVIELFVQTVLSLRVKKPSSSLTPTPSFQENPYFGSGGTLPKSDITIVSISPINGSTNISLNNSIIITFNKHVSEKEITFWLGPNINYSVTFQGSVLTAIPTTPFEENTKYYFTVKFPDQTDSKTYSFTTTGPKPTPQISGASADNFADVNMSRNKTLHPDSYIATFMPRSADTFYANYAYTPTPYPHLYFSVMLLGKDQTKAKNDFISWVKSYGLTDTQIQQLDIRYRSSQINAY